jgi:oligoendopeptidase F
MTEKLPNWDLRDFYRNLSDPHITRDWRHILRRAQQFEQTARSKITPSLTAETVLPLLQEYEAILQTMTKLELYAHLLFEMDSRHPPYGAFLQMTKKRGLTIYHHLVFFELKLAHLDKKQLERLARHPLLSSYAHWLQRQIVLAAHRLPEPQEKILADKSLTGRIAFIRLFNQEMAAKQFNLVVGRKKYVLTQAKTLDFLYSPRRPERRAAARAITQGLKEELPRLTYILNTLLEDKAITDQYRRYKFPEAEQHLANEVDSATVNLVTDLVARHYSLVQDFYHFKKKILGLSQLSDFDRYAPVVGSRRKTPFREARQIILKSFQQFSPAYAKAAQDFFDNSWIDAAPRPGKATGAFCAYVTPDLHPYVLMNYTGNIRSVMVLAHELGHGVNASLARHQNFLNFDWPLTIAETASIFGEMLVFDSLKNTVRSRQEKFALYIGKIEEIFSTIFRQTAMYRFEQDVHGTHQAQGELTAEQISHLWRKRQQEMFGRSVTLTKDYDVWWSYIPHFIHTPFYVYAYAFGELLTLALYAQYQREGSSFVPKYLELLKSGGSRSPQELLAPLGIDLNSRQFWQGGFKIIEQLVNEAKALSQ